MVPQRRDQYRRVGLAAVVEALDEALGAAAGQVPQLVIGQHEDGALAALGHVRRHHRVLDGHALLLHSLLLLLIAGLANLPIKVALVSVKKRNRLHLVVGLVKVRLG